MATSPAKPRRRGLLVTLMLVALLCGAPVAFGTWLARGGIDTFDRVDFAHKLAVPPLAPSHVDSAGRRVFDLRAAPGTHEFAPGRTADTFGFNGDYLGPTLRASRGEPVVINVHNGLTEATSVHWHGMHLPAVMDGGPHQMVEAGADWSPTWTVDQPAATLWYHPHPHGMTAKHVYRGLAGMFILDDQESDELSLPKEYGVDDVPVIVQDKVFTATGGLDEDKSLLSGIGILGDEIVVNGTLAPYLDVTTELVRLRLLNASNARSFNFGFADDRIFTLIGTDGGLISQPHDLSRIMLTPGERAEIVVQVAPNERAVLRSYPPKIDGGVLNDRFSGGKDRFDVLEIRAADSLRSSAPLPRQLAQIDRLDRASATTTRHFDLGDNVINRQTMDMSRVDATVTKDTTEIWELRNLDGAPHNFHIHDVQFQILDIAAAAPPAELSGWKDTVFVRPGATTRIIIRFADYSDRHHPYMFHCHLLYHEDQGMMGQFVVVDQGQQANISHPR